MPRIHDLAAVREILECDRVWAAFALADLTPGYRELSEWYCATSIRPALLLIYRGFRPPLLFALGAAADLGLLLPEIAHENELRFSLLAKMPQLLQGMGYRVQGESYWWRMVLKPGGLPSQSGAGTERLGPADEAELQRLYADGRQAGETPDFFHPSTLYRGVYFGIREGDALVAAAGTHVLAPGEGVAAIGNVYTRRDRRGQGLGTRVTAAVAGELVRLGVRTVVLNVELKNSRAIGVYRRLGFACHCKFREGIAIRAD